MCRKNIIPWIGYPNQSVENEEMYSLSNYVEAISDGNPVVVANTDYYRVITLLKSSFGSTLSP